MGVPGGHREHDIYPLTTVRHTKGVALSTTHKIIASKTVQVQSWQDFNSNAVSFIHYLMYYEQIGALTGTLRVPLTSAKSSLESLRNTSTAVRRPVIHVLIFILYNRFLSVPTLCVCAHMFVGVCVCQRLLVIHRLTTCCLTLVKHFLIVNTTIRGSNWVVRYVFLLKCVMFHSLVMWLHAIHDFSICL